MDDAKKFKEYLKFLELVNKPTEDFDILAPIKPKNILAPLGPWKGDEGDIYINDKDLTLIEKWVTESPINIEQEMQKAAWHLDEAVCILGLGKSCPIWLRSEIINDVLYKAVAMSNYMKIRKNGINSDQYRVAKELREQILRFIAAGALSVKELYGQLWLKPKTLVRLLQKTKYTALPKQKSLSEIRWEIASEIGKLAHQHKHSVCNLPAVYKLDRGKELYDRFLATGSTEKYLRTLLHRKKMLPKFKHGPSKKFFHAEQ